MRDTGDQGLDEGQPLLRVLEHQPQRLRLTRGERNALRTFAQFAEFEPLSKHPGIGQASLRLLIDNELAIAGSSGIFGPTFRLTNEGIRAARELYSPLPRPKQHLRA